MRKKFSLNKLMKEFLKEKLETLEIKGVYVRLVRKPKNYKWDKELSDEFKKFCLAQFTPYIKIPNLNQYKSNTLSIKVGQVRMTIFSHFGGTAHLYCYPTSRQLDAVRSNPSYLKSETLDMIYEAIQTAPVVLNRKIIIKVKP